MHAQFCAMRVTVLAAAALLLILVSSPIAQAQAPEPKCLVCEIFVAAVTPLIKSNASVEAIEKFAIGVW